MEEKTDDELAHILWDYNFMQQEPEKCDVILALGSNDIRVAQKAAELWKAGYAPYILFSGNVGVLTKDSFAKPEAEVFAEEARKLGVPDGVILLEKESTNTGKNIVLSRKVLEECELDIKKILLVQKPYMLRRAYATFKKQWPGVEFTVVAPDLSFSEYPNEILPKELVVNILVGDTQRIKIYPDKGFQIPQEIPDEVWQAYEELVKRGYTKHLMHT